jgi:signal peptidase
MNTLKQLTQIVHLLLVITVLVIASLLMVTVLPIPGNYRVLTVLSGSMEPVIQTGGIVVTMPMDSYSQRQVITFKRGGRGSDLVTHRIAAVKYDGLDKVFVTKGDANDDFDHQLVIPEQVIGRVIMTVPYVGHLTTWLQQPVGFVVAIVLPAAIIIYGELMALKQEIFTVWQRRKWKNLAMGLLIIALVGTATGYSQATLQDREVSTDNTIQAWVGEE